MDVSQLHFAHPLWLWTLLVIPLTWGLFFLYYRGQQPFHQLEMFIDKHLIPYLLLEAGHKEKKLWTHLLFWSAVWTSIVLALAGPRWDFREIATFTRDQNLVILLDLSESMNANDISPSRLGRAKQKIEDLLNMSQGVKIGLIAFAADPHMIVPMTEDKDTIRHLLPSLDTDIVYVQGSKLAPALDMAATMLQNEPGNNKAIVVISDGGFEDASAIRNAKILAEKGIVLHAIGVGTLEGAPLKDREGVVIKKNGSPIISKLEKERFREISNIGHGRYFDADHYEQIAVIFEDLEKRSDVQQEVHKTQRVWEEHFYLLLLPILPFFLIWYRRGYIFVVLLLMPIYSQASVDSYFCNAEQQAGQAYENGDYTTAAQAFQDPYRKGVAYYRRGDYAAAEEMFRQSARPEIASCAAYNLGNALVQQNKLHQAIAAYEDVLEKWPDFTQARENLELVRKMLEQQEKDKEDESQKDSPSEENEPDNSQEKENSDSDEPSQKSPEEEEAPDAEEQEQSLPPQQEREKPTPRSQEDLDADLWLNQIKNDPKSFLKNKFYLESKNNGTKEVVDPW